MARLLTIIVCFSLVLNGDSARILAVFPTPSISHQKVYRPITLELAKRGHDVVVITTDPLFVKGQAPTNYIEIDVHDVSYNVWQEFVIASSSKKKTYHEHLEIALHLLTLINTKQFETPEVQNIVQDKTQKFDLLILEACVRPAFLWTHLFKVPVIQISSYGSFPGILEDVGCPIHPLFYPLQLRQKINNLTIWETITEYYLHYLNSNIFENQMKLANLELKRVFGRKFPSVNELTNCIDITFLNIRPLWDFNRPVVPNVIYLGDLHTKRQDNKGLDKELKSYVDSSTNGFIYMSLGTNVKPSSLPRKVIEKIVNVFATMPYNILLKWDEDEFIEKPKNVKISKWFPQTDILQHPNIKVFITQGGMQSTDEAINAGVPLIGIPILNDQWYNAEMYEHHKIGVKLNIETMSEADFSNAINTVIQDGSYRANIMKLAILMGDEPQTSLERAILWMEHVLRHGGAKHLRAPAANMSSVEYFELELVSLVLGVLVLSIAILVTFIKFALNLVPCVFAGVKFKAHW